MTLEEWGRVKEVFDVVWELDPPAQESFLATACQGMDAVRAEVERLLSALALPLKNGFLEEPLQVDAALEPAGEQAGRKVGPYRLAREVGRGGMGTVYLAVREDGVHDQEVAVKISASPNYLLLGFS
jgi:hypothetical protein